MKTLAGFSTTVLIVSLLLLPAVQPAPAAAANSVEVNARAALAGNFGLEVKADASRNFAYVLSRSPKGPGNETTFRFEFLFNPNTLNSNGRQFLIVRGFEFAPFEERFRIVLKQDSPSVFRVSLFVTEDGGGRRWIGKFNVGRTTQKVGVEWAAASAPGANDGFGRLLRNGILVQERTDLDNDSHQLDSIRIGFPGATRWANVTGSYYFDEYASFR